MLCLPGAANVALPLPHSPLPPPLLPPGHPAFVPPKPHRSTVLFQACGVTITPPQSPAPAPAAAPPAPPATVDPTCAAGFQQVATTVCSASGSAQTCCPAMSGLGSPCLAQVVAALTAAGDTASLSKL